MRYLTPRARSVLYDPIQTAAKEKSLKPNFWIFHHSTPITLKRFLETQVIDLGYADGTNADIAVRHTQMGEESDRIYVACIGNDNKLKIYYADIKIEIEKQQWFQLSIALPSPESFYAEDVAIAFDGKMPKNYDGNIEFITEQDPWLFWVYDGQCFAKKITRQTVTEVDTLCYDNCTKVDAIKATSADYSGFDFGLLAFMIINGQLYYRQRIDGTWYDAEYVSAFENYNLVDLSVTRTWDYRIVVQVKDDEGHIHEIFSQYQGFAKHNTDHLAVFANVNKADLINVIYTEKFTHENLNVEIEVKTLLGYVGPIYIWTAYNIEDNGNYGKKLVVEVSNELDEESIGESLSEWTLTDSNGDTFNPKGFTLASDKKTITFSFTNFNVAVGECTIEYSGTHLTYTPGVPVNELAPFAFTPINLDPTIDPPPVLISAVIPSGLQYQDGTAIVLTFDKSITSDNIGSNTVAFEIISTEYDFIPDGNLLNNTKPVASVTIDSIDDNKVWLRFTHGSSTSVQNAESITIKYHSPLGNLGNEDGDVLSFEYTFIPSGLIKNPGVADNENLDVAISVSAILSDVHYWDVYFSDEDHLEVSSITVTAVLTHVDDL